MAETLPWWKTAVIYQLLVRSFQDSDGDGIGDLPGLLDRLDYIQLLGVDAIWLTPINPSPWCDGGYDVADYCDIHPQLGTLAIFDRLVAACHARGLRILLDWVPNHTSREHAWFTEARSSRQSLRRDWYIWQDPKPDGSPPNNWLSVFGGSAWTWEADTGQYYFHAFMREQPDLNWRNPQVRAAMHDTLRFWLARGVDGFRIDALDMVLETSDLTDNPPNPKFNPHEALDQAVLHLHTRNQPGLHPLVAGMRQVSDEFPERVLLGEAYIEVKELVRYYGTRSAPELHLPLNPSLLRQRWDADELTAAIKQYLKEIPAHGWPTWANGNHDMPRIGERATVEQERVAAMLLLTLRGTPSIYYGEEIGMSNVSIPPEMTEDPQGRIQPHRNRDVARTPMQWNDSPNAGFTAGDPLLPVADNYRDVNVARQQHDPQSLLNLYRRLLALRKAEPALQRGSQQVIERQAPTVAYLREQDGRRLLVLLNLAGDTYSFRFAGLGRQGRILFSTHLEWPDSTATDKITLRGNEGVVVVLDSRSSTITATIA
ncbi:MAG: alpha-amylase family glycosyl hydrolase [Pirellulaceae bacterium]